MCVLWIIIVVLSWCHGEASWREEVMPSRTICQDEPCRCDALARIICNCTKDYEEITLRPDGSYRVLPIATAIIVDGCSRVYFLPESISSLIQMRSIELYNIRHIYFNEKSILWSPYPREYELSNPGLRIIIDNSTVNDIASHTFRGRIDDILIKNSKINTIRPFAFSSLTGVKNIELTNNVFDNIEIQAFKKFTTVNFVLHGGHVRSLPSRLLSDVEIANSFRMNGVTVGSIASMAFLMSGPKRLIIENNVIGLLEGDAFHGNIRGTVTFKNNTVQELRKGAFLGLSVNREVRATFGLQELLIDNNTITQANLDSFLYNKTSFTLRIDGMNINQPCHCEQADTWMSLVSTHGGTIMCYYSLEEQFISLPTFVQSRCGKFKNSFWIFVLVAVILTILVGILVVFLVVRRENEKKKKLNIVMPDGKTYRETELHVIVERAELLTTDL